MKIKKIFFDDALGINDNFGLPGYYATEAVGENVFSYTRFYEEKSHSDECEARFVCSMKNEMSKLIAANS